MSNRLSTYLQYLVPQHLLTRFMGWLASHQNPRLKNKFIHYFIHKYSVDMSQATCEHPENFKDFNSFFIRTLKPELRPITPRS